MPNDRRINRRPTIIGTGGDLEPPINTEQNLEAAGQSGNVIWYNWPVSSSTANDIIRTFTETANQHITNDLISPRTSNIRLADSEVQIGEAIMNEDRDRDLNPSFLGDRSRIIDRIIRAGESSNFTALSSEGQRVMLERFSSSEYSMYDNYDFTEKPKSKDITLYEDTSVKISEEDIKSGKYVRVQNLGYFNSNDKRLVKDYLNDSLYLIIDNKYKNMIFNVYTAINDKGELEGVNYTDKYGNAEYKLPCLMLKYGSYSLFTLNLLENPTFKQYYVEDIRNGLFVHVSLKLDYPNEKAIKISYRKHKSDIGKFFESIKGKPNTFISTQNMKYKFGIEIETISGYLPPYVDDYLYYSAVHDGSLRDEDGNTYGGEYVTDILQGDLGLKQLKKLTYELSKRCLVDKRCGNHVHLSDVVFNKENITLMYYLYYSIQNEIFSMLPKSRRKNEYCRFLEDLKIDISLIHPDNPDRKFYIDKFYNSIISFLSKKESTGRNINKKKDHPKGFKCQYDHSASRYCWVNFVPAVFNTRGNESYTIEFRAMQASTSYTKIKNWLLICFALVDIVENHKQEIYKNPDLDLTHIIMSCYPKNYKGLLDYINIRKEKFKKVSSLSEELEDYQDNEIDNNFKMKNL